jgi:hypothetical protein
MVESAAYEFPPDPASKTGARPAHLFDKGDLGQSQNRAHRRWITPVALATLVAGAATIGASLAGPQSIRSSTPPSMTMRIINPGRVQLIASPTAALAVPAISTSAFDSSKTSTKAVAAPATSTSAVSSPKTITRVSSHPPAVRVAVPEPPVATLVAEVEASGLEPGSNWSWSMGDTATHCGFIAGAGTGCTFGADGDVKTVFGGSPTLALVAHELANAETLNDAVPTLMAKVSAAESGASWSPTDALASCLVAHFMGFQDAAAGAWRCPDALARYVAQNIHDTAPVNTELTLICGKKSNTSSTLTFTASAGLLTVKGPAIGSASRTVTAGTPVTVSGVGIFTGRDQGGVITAAGMCAP